MEVWKAVVGFGNYEVSSLGRVRRVGRGKGAVVGRILREQPTENGYRSVFLWLDGKQYTRLAHCLVAAAFHGAGPKGHEVNHDDGNKARNVPSNLEWMTRSDNLKHAYRIGLRERRPVSGVGEAHHNVTLTDAQVDQIRKLYASRTYPGTRLAREFGVNHSTIYRIVNRRIRKVPS